jgi:hypothetical protein
MRQWYYRDPQCRKIGPLSDDEFEECVADGEIQPATRVWRSGLADWTTYAALLAHEANCVHGGRGPTIHAAPWSRSYTTSIACGASVVSYRLRRCSTITPVSTPREMPPRTFEPCPDCGVEVPSQLFRQVDGRWICGFCLLKHEVNAHRVRSRETRAAEAGRLGKLLVTCALAVAALLVGRILLFESHHAAPAPARLPDPGLAFPADLEIAAAAER